MKSASKLIIALGISLSLTSCANMGKGETIGTVGGGIAGGLIGSQFGGGAGATLMTVGGAVAGSMAGNAVGRSYDKK